MNEQFRVAQATSGNSNTASPPRIFKLTKPFADQAVVLNLGYDQKVQVDFSAIANEKITLVHIGEKLIILFDNHSTVTVEPFFDSRHDQLGNLTIEVAPGRNLTVGEFASAFPIINDPSAASAVLPAAGDSLGQNNAQASGANFSPFTVDPLPPVPTNILAPQEELPGFQIQLPTGFIPQTPLPESPTIDLGTLPNLTVDESFLTVATNGIAGSGQGPLGVTVASGLLPFTINAPGGQQSLTFALSISAPGVDTGLIDSQTGNHVFLFVENGVVVGREGANVGTAASGLKDFTVSVDAAGNITLTDLRSVHQGSGEVGDANEGTQLPAGVVTLTATVTDNSNQSASASVDVGPHLTLQDDGPSISPSGQTPTLTVDETVLATDASANFAGAFTPVFGADGPLDANHDGAADAGAVTYALGISASGADSGLIDTLSGNHIFLFLEGGQVVGREGTSAAAAQGVGPIDFVVSVSGSTVTLDQQRSVVHPDATNPDDGKTLSAANLITLTATVTDGDLDTKTATLNIGQSLNFKDDGPSISPSGQTPTLTVDETVLATDASANFAGAFTPVFGADGPLDANHDGAADAGAVTYALGISASGADSGLIDTLSGNHIFLFLEGGQVVGREGTSAAAAQGVGPIDFVVSVSGSTVTLDQQRSVVHPDATNPDDGKTLSAANLITLTATVTDGDLDTKTATLNIGQSLNFKDDGPSISPSGQTPTLTVDETVLATDASANFAGAFTPVFGADGPLDANHDGAADAGAVTYALGISASGADSGLIDTLSGNHIFLFLEGGQVVGREGTSAAAAQGVGPIDFVVSVSGSTVTLDQQRSVVHPDATNPDDGKTLSAANLITLTATVTDGDLDTKTATLNIGQSLNFKDDGPSISPSGQTPTLTVDETVLATDASANFAGAFTPVFGADGPLDANHDGAADAGAVTYALGISASGADSGLIDTLSGNHIFLFLEGGQVVGREGTSAAAAQGVGPIDFVVSVSGSTVTLDQQRSVVHPDATNPDDGKTLSAANLITLTATVTDGDLDTKTATLNIGQSLNFKDDGPSISPSGQTPTLTVDETVLATDASANFAGAFTPVFGADGPLDANHDGAADAGAVTYALGISASGADSGLIDTLSGNHIFLFLEGGQVVGREGTSAAAAQGVGPIDFVVSVSGSTVTLDQQRSVVHPDATNPDDGKTLSAANLITLTATVTDGDLDTKTATLNIGQSLNFKDDGPSISPSGQTPTLTVDETVLATDASANFAGAFTPVFGADGPLDANHDGAADAGAVTYALGISASGADSGLIDTLSGNHIFLFLEGGQVVGREGTSAAAAQGVGPIDFVVSVSGSTVTLDQQRSVVHPDATNPDDGKTLSAANLITLTATVTDGDLDTKTATLNIGQSLNFKDDGPSISPSGQTPTLTVDETVLATDASANFAGAFTPVFGADGPLDANHDGAADAGAVTYALGISASGADSGLIDTLSGNHIFLFLEGGQVVGREGTSAAAAQGVGPIDFVVSVSGSTVTLDQQRSVVHPDATNPDDGKTLSAANLITLTATVTDGDLDTKTATLNIGQSLNFKDDGPSISPSGQTPTLTVDETVLATDASANFAGAFTPVFGADGPLDANHDGVADAGAVTYALGISASGADSGLIDTLSGNHIFLFLEGGQVVGREGTSAAAAQGVGPIDFVVSVSGSTVTLDQQRSVVHPDATNPDDGKTLSAANLITLTATVTDGDLDTKTATLNIGQSLNFKDDGPSISPSGQTPTLTVDETVLATDASANFAGAFTPVFGADGPLDANHDGAADAGAVTYALGISASGADSGLIDTLSGNHIFLFLEGGQVVGREGTSAAAAQGVGPIDFVVSVSGSTVTLDQQRSVVHPDATNPDDGKTLSAANLITLTATVTDGDLDTKTATLNIGQSLNFKDDGPSISPSGQTPTLTVDETVLATDASANFAGAFTPVFGADGPLDANHDGAADAGAVTYALGISASGADSGLIDTLSGNHIFLFLEGGQVVGREGTSAAAAQGVGPIDFVVSVSGSTVTLDQQRSVVHPDATNPDDGKTLSAANLITLTATVTDGDLDTKTATLNIGQSLNFKDDGPSISPSGQTPTLTVDETVLATDASANFAGAFTPVFGADGPLDANHDGAADAGAVTYALGISASGADSGLIDTLSGNHIFLFLEGGQVVGREGTSAAAAQGVGPIDFVVSVSGSTVTLDQQRSVVHPDATNPDDGKTLSAANLITLTATVTDGDLDTKTATLNIGQSLNFKDDGPSISPSGQTPTLTVDETVLATDASANFAGAFTPVFGADGPLDANHDGAADAGAVTYALGISASGADSGLIDTLSGNHIFLFLEGGQVVGREGTSAAAAQGVGPIDFVVSVSGSTVTLDQQRSVVHPDATNPDDGKTLSAANLITLTATVTDGDLDTKTATLNIGQSLNFKDDGPSISPSGQTPTLTVDETVLATDASANFAGAFTPVFGADGPLDANHDGAADAGAVTYALGISASGADSGLIDTLSGNHIFLFLEGGQVVGREGTSAAAAQGVGPIDFVVSVSGSTVTLDQQRSVVHPDATNPDDGKTLSAANLITLTATVTDGDLDTKTATLNIGQSLNFKDDGPSISPSGQTPTLTVDETVLATDASANFAGAFTPVFGADGPLDANHDGVADAGAVTYALGISASGADSGLIDTLSGNHIFLFLEGGQVVGREGTSAAAAQGVGPIDFVVSVSGSTVTLDQQRSVVHPDATNPDDGKTLSAANLITLTATVTDGDLDTKTATLNIGQSLNFKDDGPSISPSGQTPTLTVDETVLATDASANFAGAFTPVFGADGPLDANHDGAADAGAVTYALGISASGADSGLIDTLSGNHIFLFLEGGQVVGREGTSAAAAQGVGPIDFVVSVSGSTVTLDQQRSVVHPDATNPDDGKTLSAANLITLTATVTDGDLDTKTATLNIGQSLNFKDDGPSISPSGQTPTLTVDETVLATDASANFAGAFTPVFGADGPLDANHDGAADAGAVTYALGISASGADSGLIDTLSGNHIFLFLEGGQVVGREGTSAAAAQGVGPIDFVVSVSGSTVTLDQQRSVVHPDATNPDDGKTLSAANLITLTATVTDGDLDTKTATLNIGQSLNFKDDGPSISPSGQTPTLTVDETVLATDASANFAGAFTPVFGADGPLDANHDGAADAGAVTYALGISASGADSGLIDTLSGNHIFLFLEGGQVVGREGTSAAAAQGVGPIDFVVSVSGSTVTLDQQRSVVHPDATNPDDGKTLSAANLITLTATVTDGDLDTKTATLNIGQSLNFKDDGPSISPSGQTPTLTVDETVLATDASANFAGAFTPVFGADGPLDANHDGAADAGAVTYALGISASGADSGLIDTLSGNHIFLFLEGGQVVGREGTSAAAAQGVGPIDFVVSVSGSTVTLDQQRSVVHPDATNPDDGKTLSAANLITLTATVTDGDLDTKTATLNIGQSLNFKDDGPSISPSGQTPTLTVDETVLATDASANFAGAFTPVFGADGPLDANHDGAADAGAVTYALGISASGADSGLIDTLSGNHIFLFLEGGQVVGREGTSAAAAQGVGPIDFVVSVSGSTVTLDQQRSVVHPDATNPDDGKTLSAANLITLTATVTDGDLDTKTATLNIGQSLNFKDDGPSNIIPGIAVVKNGSGIATVQLDFDTNTDNNYGADGGTVRFSTSLNGPTTLTSNGATINESVSGDGHTLTGYVDSNHNGSFDSGVDTKIFTVTLNLDGSVATAFDTYTVQMFGTVDSPTHIDFSTGGYNFVGGNSSWAEFIPAGETVANPIDNNSLDLLLTPAINHLPDGTVNTNANEGGIGSGNSVGASETFRIDFVIDSRGDPADGAGNYSTPANRDHVFDGHYTVNGASADFTSTTGSTVNIKTFDDPDGIKNNIVGDGAADTVTGVSIKFGAATSGLIDLSAPGLQTVAVTVGGHNYTVTEMADGSVNVAGVFGNNTGTTTVAVFTSTGYNSVEYTYVADQTFKIGNFGAAAQSTDPVNLNIPVQVVDGDGDTAIGNLNIELLSGTAATQDHHADSVGGTFTSTVASPSIIGSGFNDTLNGDGNANILYGGAGVDILNGNGGNDTLFGNADGDTLNGGAGDDTFVLQAKSTGHDTIGDFLVSGNDQIIVDIGGGLTIATAASVDAANFHTGDENVAATWNGGTGKEFVYNSTSHELWYSANGTGSDKIDVAHMSTGVPSATNVHTI
ncbi:DUF5801 repeats-in-toxin domain-containing protein [Bradyrhizobium sp. DASA03120]|uniref:DUF5801 repeats-in-toxin domain-containing protein n=1 Tax=Bradyrhizobium sp. SMVTL-02 TaxID=3395917 RepID=UPI003F72A6AD